jgi:biopolymer transport protein ExbD
MKTTLGDGGKYQIMSEINMIPLIDVSLVLLIIFMIMTPLLAKHAQIKINMPEAKATVTPEQARNVEVTVDKAGAVFVDGSPVAAAALEDLLRRRITDPKTQSVIILADKDVSFDRVVAVMDTAKRLDMRSLGVGVKPKTEVKPDGRAARPKRP